MLSLVPDEIERYVARHTSPEPAARAELAAATEAHVASPQMLVGHVQGLFLKNLVRAMGARRVLEIGTYTGYSALCMAEGLPDDGKVITCDIDRTSTDVARRYWQKSPHGAKIDLRLGRALATLDDLEGPFDLVFIDADKSNYIAYWEKCVPLLRVGGLILADNVLWSGRVLDPKEADDRAIAAFNERVRKDDRVEATMLTVRDGITMACKR